MLNTIIEGDHVDVLQAYPDGYFDMFLTSPPYDNLRDYKGYEFRFEPLAHELYRTLKPGGVGVWIVNDATVNGSETLTSFKQAIYFKEEVGFNIHDTMIYAKLGVAYPNTLRYYASFEYMFVLSKGAPQTVHLLTDKKNRTQFRSISGRERRPNGELKTIKKGRRIKEFGVRQNVWMYSTGFNNTAQEKYVYGHPAAFPEKLAEDHILSWSNSGDVILDPMCGSGTTCKMAVKHQRQYVGIDCAEGYCELARKRLKNFRVQTTIFDEQGATD
jgi:site-specific DNA-methyltransferase (adenine-specific)